MSGRVGGIVFWLSFALAAYTYVGYPLLIGLLARMRPVRQSGSPATPTATLIISALDEAEVIRDKLDNVQSLDYPSELLQVIVAADGSTDATTRIVQEYASRGVELSYQPERRGKAAALTRAAEQVRNEVIVLSDANNLYAPEMLRHLLAPFGDPRVGAVAGAKTIVAAADGHQASEGLYWRYERWINEQEWRLGCVTSAAGEALAVRRELWQSPPPGIINDDFYLIARVMRHGYRIGYAAEARSFEPAAATPEAEAVRRSRIVAGRFQAIALARSLLPFSRPLLVFQIISHKFLRPLVPVAMLGMLAGNIVALANRQPRGVIALGGAWARLMLAVQALFYAAAALGTKAQGVPAIGRLLYLPTFLVRSNWAALVGAVTFIRGRQTSTWQRAKRGAWRPEAET